MSKKRRTLRELWSHDIAIDLGTANTLVALRRQGIIINEPSLVATRGDNEIIAVGAAAQQMLGRSPKSITVTRPLVDGVVANFEATEFMLKYFIDRVHDEYKTVTRRPRVVVGLPATVTDVERRAVKETVRSTGARKVMLIEEPVAAALGAGVPIFNSKGSIVVDIGGGTTEIALISFGGITATKSLRIAGDELTDVIIEALKHDAGLQIGIRTAEKIKCELASVHLSDFPPKMNVKGKDVLTGLPKQVEVRPEQLIDPLIKQLRPIIDAVRGTIEETPAELLVDIMDQGIVLTGGGAKLRGIEDHFAHELKMRIVIPKNALTTVVEGAAHVFRDIRVRNMTNSAGGSYE